MSFVKATRRQSRLKLAIDGPAGAGKSYTGLRGLFALVRRGLASRVAVITSEGDKVHKEAGRIVDGTRWQFEVNSLTSFSPAAYVAAIDEAIKLGFDAILIDSLSHEWQGAGGALEIVDRLESKNKFAGWKVVTPQHNRFIDCIMRAPAHIIATIRSKQGYILQTEEKNGRTMQVPVRVGMEPIQRNGVEYEFEIFVRMDRSHVATIEKTICSSLDGLTFVCPGDDLFGPIADWLSEGEEMQPDVPRQASADLNALLERAIAVGLDMDGERAFIERKWGAGAFIDLTAEQLAAYTRRVDQAATVAAVRQAAVDSAVASGETFQEAVDSLPSPEPVPIKGDPDAVGWTGGIMPKFEEWCMFKAIDRERRPGILAGLCERFGNGATTLRALSIQQCDELDKFMASAVAKCQADHAASALGGASAA